MIVHLPKTKKAAKNNTSCSSWRLGFLLYVIIKEDPWLSVPSSRTGLAFHFQTRTDYNIVMQFVKLFFGIDTTGKIALLKYGHEENFGGCLIINSR